MQTPAMKPVQRRLQPSDRLVIATHNAGKRREFRKLLGSYLGTIVSAADLALPEPEETGTTFIENAVLKAVLASERSHYIALADDSGLCVNALNGDPGLYSARWAGPARDFTYAMKTVNEKLGDGKDRSAYFICVLALVWPDGHQEIIEGRINGTIVWPPRGTEGHGYDPVFMPDGDTRTFAEMGEEEKNKISHRGRAVQMLIEKFCA